MMQGGVVVSVSALVMAAGASRRMGKVNKLLLPFRGETLLAGTVKQVKDASLAEVLVVLGHDYVRCHKVVQEMAVKSIQHRHWQQGLTSSIQAGLQALASRSDGLLIQLADMPLVSTAQIEQVLALFRRHRGEKIIVPHYGNQPGHPVVFPRRFFPAIQALAANDNGCRKLIRNHPDAVVTLICGEAGIVQDIDKPADYARLVRPLQESA